MRALINTRYTDGVCIYISTLGNALMRVYQHISGTHRRTGLVPTHTHHLHTYILTTAATNTATCTLQDKCHRTKSQLNALSTLLGIVYFCLTHTHTHCSLYVKVHSYTNLHHMWAAHVHVCVKKMSANCNMRQLAITDHLHSTLPQSCHDQSLSGQWRWCLDLHQWRTEWLSLDSSTSEFGGKASRVKFTRDLSEVCPQASNVVLIMRGLCSVVDVFEPGEGFSKTVVSSLGCSSVAVTLLTRSPSKSSSHNVHHLLTLTGCFMKRSRALDHAYNKYS